MTTVSKFLGRMCPLLRHGFQQSFIARTCVYPSLLATKTWAEQSPQRSFSTTLYGSRMLLCSQTNQPGSISMTRNYAVQSSEADRGQLVYTGRVGSVFRMLKLFSLTTSAIGLSLQPYLFVTYQDAPLVTALPFFAALNMFVFVNPFLIHYIGKKYVMEVYFNQDTKIFTAVLMSFFARKYTFTFTAADVKVPDVPGLFAILNVKDRPLFVLESDFTDIEVYKHMMGFDRPLDLTFLREDKEKKDE